MSKLIHLKCLLFVLPVKIWLILYDWRTNGFRLVLFANKRLFQHLAREYRAGCVVKVQCAIGENLGRPARRWSAGDMSGVVCHPSGAASRPARSGDPAGERRPSEWAGHARLPLCCRRRPMRSALPLTRCRAAVWRRSKPPIPQRTTAVRPRPETAPSLAQIGGLTLP